LLFARVAIAPGHCLMTLTTFIVACGYVFVAIVPIMRQLLAVSVQLPLFGVDFTLLFLVCHPITRHQQKRKQFKG
jgi:hypothetical protein